MKAQQTRTDRRTVRNRKALLKAAEAILAEKGFEQCTIDEITESADLAKGTFYNHFADKKAIASEVALMIRQELEAEVKAVQAGVEDPAERLASGMCVFFRCAVKEPARAAVVAQMYRQWLRPEAAGNAGLRKDLEDGFRAGRFSGTELGPAVVMSVGIVQAGMTRALEIADWKAVRTLSAKLCALVLRGLGLKWNQAQVISVKTVTRVFDIVSSAR